MMRAPGCPGRNANTVQLARAAAIRALTDKPFVLNCLLFFEDDVGYGAALVAGPSVISLAWPRRDRDLAGYIDRAHDAGCKVMAMPSAAYRRLVGMNEPKSE
jgi:hypothetical protein